MTQASESNVDFPRALPGDDVRRILWRFEDRLDLQMLVQSVRGAGDALLQVLEESGITGEGPENLAMALVAYELAWVDSGAAMGSLAEAAFRRARITVAIMTSAKLLSAVEPVIRYGRSRFRGGSMDAAGSPRYQLGLQLREDVVHRLVEVWAAGEASASLGFEAARLFDKLDSLETHRDEVLDSVANVLSMACRLWNTGHGAHMMREAVSLMGGSGITEDCPGFLGQKWMDAQLAAAYEGPEAVQRRQLSAAMADELFLEQFCGWVGDMRSIAEERPVMGAGALASAMDLWLWTLQRCRSVTGGGALADALCFLLASRAQILDVIELAKKGPQNPRVAEGLPGLLTFLGDLCHVQAVRAAGEIGRTCAGLVFGHGVDDPDEFARLRARLDASLTGSQRAKDRAAEAVMKVAIPEVVSYPV